MTRLRPSNDRFFSESLAHRRKNWSQRSWLIARGKSVAARSMVMFKTSYPQSHRAYDQVTYDLAATTFFLESLTNRRENARLYAEVIGDRRG